MKQAVGAAMVLLIWPVLVEAAGLCRVDQLKVTFVGSDGAMGSDYTVIKFRNVANNGCKLESNFVFERFDSKGVRMPITADKNVAVNMVGAGVAKAVLGPQHETEITIRTSWVPHDESQRCGAKMRISQESGSGRRILISYPLKSCSEDVSVTGFHSLE